MALTRRITYGSTYVSGSRLRSQIQNGLAHLRDAGIAVGQEGIGGWCWWTTPWSGPGSGEIRSEKEHVARGSKGRPGAQGNRKRAGQLPLLGCWG
jgi:hypothetical protein